MRTGLLCLLLASSAVAAEGEPSWRATLAAERSALSHGLADWTAASLLLERRWSPRQLAQVELTRTRRFGTDDEELAIGGSQPLGPALTLSARASYSPTHRILARSSVAASLQYEVRRGWLLHGGLRTSRHAATSVDQASLMLEHYFGDWSALGAVHATRAFGRASHGFELRATWYYRDDASVGLIASNADEATQVAADRLVLAPVRSLALVGRHPLGGRWSLRYGAHHVRQGSFYTRRGASLGVQAVF